MVAVLVLGMSGWFLFDGVYTYPFENVRWTEFQKYGEKRHAEWLALAQSRGWSATPPHEFHSPDKVREQFVFAGIMALAGTAVLAYWMRERGKVVKTDAEAVYAPSGKRIPFTALVSVDKKKWDTKGLATVYYRLDGRSGKFLLDDYKYNAKALQRVMAEIEEAQAAAAKTGLG